MRPYRCYLGSRCRARTRARWPVCAMPAADPAFSAGAELTTRLTPVLTSGPAPKLVMAKPTIIGTSPDDASTAVTISRPATTMAGPPRTGPRDGSGARAAGSAGSSGWPRPCRAAAPARLPKNMHPSRREPLSRWCRRRPLRGVGRVAVGRTLLVWVQWSCSSLIWPRISPPARTSVWTFA